MNIWYKPVYMYARSQAPLSGPFRSYKSNSETSSKCGWKCLHKLCDLFSTVKLPQINYQKKMNTTTTSTRKVNSNWQYDSLSLRKSPVWKFEPSRSLRLKRRSTRCPALHLEASQTAVTIYLYTTITTGCLILICGSAGQTLGPILLRYIYYK